MNSMMLAQLMKDLQDPEMVAQAQQMMKDPNFQTKMKQMSKGTAFKQSMEKTRNVLKDPEKVKEITKTMELKVEEGNKKLEELEKQETANKKGDDETEVNAAEDQDVKKLSDDPPNDPKPDETEVDEMTAAEGGEEGTATTATKKKKRRKKKKKKKKKTTTNADDLIETKL